MDDLIPFLIFIVIALINLVKFVLEKNAKKAPLVPGEEKPKSQPSVIEQFFGDLAQKLEPQPTPVPDWPVGYERPDYSGEQEEYEAAQEEEYKPEPVAEIIPLPVVETVSATPARVHSVSLKAAMSAMPPITSGLGSLQLPSTQMKSGTGGSINYSLRNKAELRRAIIANIVFSTPRSCDPSFENTNAK
jgi:hypothetical protein